MCIAFEYNDKIISIVIINYKVPMQSIMQLNQNSLKMGAECGLYECAAFFEQEGSRLNKSSSNAVVNTDICMSFHPLMQEALLTTDSNEQKLIIDTITTATAGADIVQRLLESGELKSAETISTEIKTKLDKIQEMCSQKSSTTSSAQQRLYSLEEMTKHEDMAHLLQLAKSGDMDDSLLVASKRVPDQIEILKGAALGVGDTAVALADPRTIVTGTVQLVRAGCFVIEQLGQLEAYADAMQRGDIALAQHFESAFKNANAEVLHAAAQWYENFKELPLKEQSRVVTSMGLTALFAKPVAGLQMKVVGIGLNGIRRNASMVAGKVANAIRENPTAEAMAAEGIGLAAKAAEEGIGAENAVAQGTALLEETENAAKAGTTAKVGASSARTTAADHSGELRKAGNASNITGKKFENSLIKKFGGTGEFEIISKKLSCKKQFDGAFDNIWYEAKAGGYWAELEKSEVALSKFRTQIVQKLKIAQENGKLFMLYTNSPIPQFLKEWFAEKGIGFQEFLINMGE